LGRRGTRIVGENNLELGSPPPFLRLFLSAQGGPGFRAGPKPGDEILQVNQHALGNWTDTLSLPAYLTVKRDGLPLEMMVK